MRYKWLNGTELTQAEGFGAGFRLLPDHETRLQHGSRRVYGVVSAGAAAGFHEGDCERLAGVTRRARPWVIVHHY